MPGEEVVLKGSLPIDARAWRPYKDGIYRQSLKGTAFASQEINHQLFMQDNRMVRAWYPNWDYSNPFRSGKGYLICAGGSTTDIEWKAVDLDDRKSAWQNPQKGIVHSFHKNNWGNFQFRIKDID